jgi:hypothetical protein
VGVFEGAFDGKTLGSLLGVADGRKLGANVGELVVGWKLSDGVDDGDTLGW